MTIQNLSDIIKDITLNSLELRSFYVGNTFNMSATKGDKYKCLWLEMPILIDYTLAKKPSKQFTFSIDILDLPDMDNTTDEICKISECEKLGDLFLQYLQQNRDFSLVEGSTGLTVKALNADNACGIRIDIKVITSRECLPK